MTGPIAALPEPVTRTETPLSMHYTYVPGAARSAFLRGLARRELVARACPRCEQVYVPAPDFCARCLCELGDGRVLSGRGAIETFCIVSFPFPGQSIEPPYAVAHIRLHGADTRIMHLIREIDLDDIEIGLEVDPVWEDGELEPSWMSIRHFRPAPAERTEEAADA